MKKVLATIDNSLAARPVLAVAQSLADVLGARVEALHVKVDGDETARTAAASAAVPYRAVEGRVVERLVREGGDEDAAALVMGARRLPADPRPLGATAVAVATRLLKPVVVVPPEARVASSLRRVLVPLEGTDATSLAPRSLIEVAREASIDVVALHVVDADAIPAFTDQPQHEQPAWAREFLARYCPWGIESVRLETRIGRPADVVPRVARECGCDLIALGWAQELELGRAAVVRAALAGPHVPVMLVPVQLIVDTRRPTFVLGAGRA
jgi:nucleotide-binding universal stress UspA family protein